MNILADENTHAEIVRWLRGQGHDVLWAGESLGGQSDEGLLNIALQQHSVILTADLDFGKLVFQNKHHSHGIILLRLEHLKIQERLARLKECWPEVEAHPGVKFLVISEEKLRVRTL